MQELFREKSTDTRIKLICNCSRLKDGTSHQEDKADQRLFDYQALIKGRTRKKD